MNANPDKFQALAVGEKAFALKPVLKIGEAEVEFEETGKLLGVEIQNQNSLLVNFAYLYLSRFASVCNRVADFNARNKCLTATYSACDY